MRRPASAELHTPLVQDGELDVLAAGGIDRPVYPGDGPGPGDLLMLRTMGYRVNAEHLYLEPLASSGRLGLPGVEVIQSELSAASGFDTAAEAHADAPEVLPPEPNS